MSKRRRGDTGEDLFHWAERRDLAAEARALPALPGDEPMVLPRQPKGIAKVLSVLGLRSSGESLTR